MTDPDSRPPRLLFIAESLARNSVGRTYALWLVAQHLGWESRTASIRGDALWSPLQGTDFAATTAKLTAEEMEAAARDADLIVACKPLPESLELASGLSRATSTPLLLDIDDPDLEVRSSLSAHVIDAAANVLLRRMPFRESRLRRLAAATPRIVSNPTLQAIYGGTIVPHARLDPGAGRSHVAGPPTVAFVGTNRPNKGLPELRAAVAEVQDLHYRLVVTDDAPRDAQPWESWVGPTSLADGLALVSNGSDIVVLPSRDTAGARGQLPAKLMDAMLAGRAIAVSDVDPMPWAIGDAGRVFPAGDVAAIVRVLREFDDPLLRARLGADARARAREMFTVEAVADVFAQACRDALADRR